MERKRFRNPALRILALACAFVVLVCATPQEAFAQGLGEGAYSKARMTSEMVEYELPAPQEADYSAYPLTVATYTVANQTQLKNALTTISRTPDVHHIIELTQDIALTSTLTVIQQQALELFLTIKSTKADGEPARLTVNGNFRHLKYAISPISGAPDQAAYITLDGVILSRRDGYTGEGGGIEFENSSAITHCDVYLQAGSGGAVLTNNRGISYGGAIQVKDRLALEATGIVFADNLAVSGGAVYSTKGFTGINCLFTGNTVQGASGSSFGGGAIHSYASLALHGCVFENNQTRAADTVGGAVLLLYLAGKTNNVYLEGNTFRGNGDGNSAGDAPHDQAINGGAIALQGPIASYTSINNTFTGNSAQRGGAVMMRLESSHNASTNVTIQGDTYEDNLAYRPGSGNSNVGVGGALFIENSAGANRIINVEIGNSQFVGNKAESVDGTDGNGGAIYMAAGRDNGANVIVADGGGAPTVFSGNVATQQGGAVYMLNGATLALRGESESAPVVFEDNIAGTRGGAIASNERASSGVSGQNIAFRGNTATGGNYISVLDLDALPQLLSGVVSVSEGNGLTANSPYNEYDVMYHGQSYTVTYNANGGIGTYTDPNWYGPGVDAVLYDGTAFSREHYDLVGWSTSQTGGTVLEPGSEMTVNGNINLYAVWDVARYDVTFDTDGGTSIESQRVAYGGLVDVPASPSKTSDDQLFVFDGWFKDESRQTPWDFDADTVEADTTIWAKWETTDLFVVTYNTNGGSYVPPETYADGEKLDDPGAPSRTGYTFTGWYKDEDLSEKWNFETERIGGSMTLYAGWDVIRYTVTFDSQSGSAVDPQTVAFDSAVPKPADPERHGYVFDGWFREDTCENTWNFAFDTMPAEDMTLYAGWTRSYTVTFQTGGGSAVAAQTVREGGYATAPAEPTRAGHIFNGWYSDSATSDPFNFNSTPIMGNKTLYAGWQKETYVITFDPANGEAPFTKGAEYQQPVEEPENEPTNFGYSLLGWSATGSADDLWDFNTRVNGPMTLTAVWAEGPFLVHDEGELKAALRSTRSHVDIWLANDILLANQIEARSTTSQYQGASTVYITISPYVHDGYFAAGQQAHITQTGSELRHFQIEYGDQYQLDITLTNIVADSTTGYGGIDVRSGSVFSLHGAGEHGLVMTGATKWNFGGAMRVHEGATLNADNLTLDGNKAGQYGGGIYVEGGIANITNAAFMNNYAPRGGGISVRGEGARLNLEKAEITDNSATLGGGLYITEQCLPSSYMKDVVFGNNTAERYLNVLSDTDEQVFAFAKTRMENITGISTSVEGVTSDIIYNNYDVCYTYGISLVRYSAGEVARVTPTVPTDKNGYGNGAMVQVAAAPADGPAYHSFEEWNTRADGSGEGYQPDDTFAITSDTTLHARWVNDTTVVTFDANGGAFANGQGTPEPTLDQTVLLGQRATQPEDPEKAGEYLQGWALDTNGAQMYDFDAIVEGPLTLYAVWDGMPPNHVAVRFHTNGGSYVPTQVIPTGTMASEPGEPTRTGYAFEGWYTTDDFTPGTKYEFDVPVNASLDLYVDWALVTYELTATAGVGGSLEATVDGVGATLPTFDVTVESSITLKAIPAANYLFAGWAIDGVPHESETDELELRGLAADHTVEAQFRLQQHRVTFRDSYEDELGSILVEHEGTIQWDAPGVPDTSTLNSVGESFAHWATKNGQTFERWEDSYTVTGPVVLYPVFTTNRYTVTFDANGGTMQTTTAEVEHSEPIPTGDEYTPTRDGYDFGGWLNGVSLWDAFDPVTQDMTLTARWLGRDAAPISVDITASAQEVDLGDTVTLTAEVENSTRYTGLRYRWYEVGGSNPRLLETTSTNTYTFAPAAGQYSYYVEVQGTDTTATGNTAASGSSGNANIFVQQYFTITAEYGEGGQIVPAGETGLDGNRQLRLPAGSTQSFAILAEDGYRLADLKLDGTSIALADQYTFDRLAADHTLTAVFVADAVVEDKEYTVTYRTNGGTGNPPLDNRVYGEDDEATALDGAGLSKQYYSFVGWSEDPGADVAEYTPGSPIRMQRDMVLYAVWQRNTVKVTLEAGTGTFEDGASYRILMVPQGELIPIPDSDTLHMDDHFVAYWHIGDNTPYDYSTIALVDTVLYAAWEAEQEWVVVYHTGDGPYVDTVTIQTQGGYEAPLDAPDEGEWTGHSFEGWFTSPGMEPETQWTFGRGVKADDTDGESFHLYGKWVAVPMDIVFVQGDGNDTTEQHSYGTAVEAILPTATPIAYKSFAGWFTDTARNAPVTHNTRLTENGMRIYALWDDMAAPAPLVAPAASEQDIQREVEVGESTTLAVVGTPADSYGTGAISYQWYRASAAGAGDVLLDGETDAELTIEPSETGIAVYYCVVTFTDSNYSLASTASARSARFIVAARVAGQVVDAQEPAIQDLSGGGRVVQGAEAELAVDASVEDGGILSYQWYRVDGDTVTPIAGARDATYRPGTGTVGTYRYFVEVTNTNLAANGEKAATVRSEVIELRVYTDSGYNCTVTGPDDNGDLNGTGVPGGTVEITWPDGGTDVVDVDQNGNWSVGVPDGVKPGDEVELAFKDKDNNLVEEITYKIPGEDDHDCTVTGPDSNGDLNGTGVPGGSVEITWPDGGTSVVDVDKDGNWSVSVPDGVEPGDKVELTFEDEDGNVVDEIIYEIPGEEDYDCTVTGPDSNGDLNGTGVPGGSVEITWPDGGTSVVDVDKDGNWSVSVPDGVEPGDKVELTFEDEDGNVVDEIIYEIPGEEDYDCTVTGPDSNGDLNGTGVPGGSVEITWPDGGTSIVDVDKDGNWSVSVPDGVEPGDEVELTFKDKDGNIVEEIIYKVPGEGDHGCSVGGPDSNGDLNGTGVPGGSVEITWPDGGTSVVDVDKDGNWSVKVPDGVNKGDKVELAFKDKDGNTVAEITYEMPRAGGGDKDNAQDGSGDPADTGDKHTTMLYWMLAILAAAFTVGLYALRVKRRKARR